MRKATFILLMLIGYHGKGQKFDSFKQIDSVVKAIDAKALNGSLDTIKGGLLNEGNTNSNIYILKAIGDVKKILVVNESKNYKEKIIYQDGRPIFAQLFQSDGSIWTTYFVKENAYLKKGKKFQKVNGIYWRSKSDAYLSLFDDKILQSGS